jgi:hypothetical protein
MTISFMGGRFLAGACAGAGAEGAACLRSAMSVLAKSAEWPRLAHLRDQDVTLFADYSGPVDRAIGRIRRTLGDCFGGLFRP